MKIKPPKSVSEIYSLLALLSVVIGLSEQIHRHYATAKAVRHRRHVQFGFKP